MSDWSQLECLVAHAEIVQLHKNARKLGRVSKQSYANSNRMLNQVREKTIILELLTEM